MPAGEIKTVAVIAASSYGDLVSDIGFMGSLAERPELGQMIDGMVAMFTQGKGLVGLDKSKPWGVILQTDGQQFLPVGCLPVTDLGQALQVVQGFGIQIQDGEDGAKMIPLPSGQVIYIKQNGGWAFIANSPASFDVLPDDPLAVLSSLITEYDLGARISVQNVPDGVSPAGGGRDEGRHGARPRAQGRRGRRDLRNAARKMAEMQMQQLEQMVDEIDEIVVGLRRRRPTAARLRRLHLSLPARQQDGASKSSRTVSRAPTSPGFYQPDAAATMSFASKADPEVIKENIEQMKSMMLTMRKQAEKAIDEEEDIPDDATRDAVKAAMGDMIDAMEATIDGR